jgi:ABC-type transport system substrate-binding protein
MPGYTELGAYQGPDTARARALLRAAGYPNGISTKLYGYSTEPYSRVLTLVQHQLADAGIHADLDIGEAAGYTSMAEVVSNHIAFGLYGWYADYLDASNFFDTLLNGKRIQPIHNINLSLFDDAPTNAMIERAMQTADDSTRFRMWSAVDRRVMALAPVAPMLHLQESRVYHPRLGGWYRHVTRLFKIESLYLKKPGAAPARSGPPA